MSVLRFPTEKVISPRKVYILTVKETSFGRIAGKPLANLAIARSCVEICKAIKDQQP